MVNVESIHRKPNGIHRWTLREIVEKRLENDAWLWTDCGDGQLEPIRYVMPTSWNVVCGMICGPTRTYHCTPDGYAYTYDSAESRRIHEANCRGFLRDRRQHFAAQRAESAVQS